MLTYERYAAICENYGWDQTVPEDPGKNIALVTVRVGGIRVFDDGSSPSGVILQSAYAGTPELDGQTQPDGLHLFLQEGTGGPELNLENNEDIVLVAVLTDLPEGTLVYTHGIYVSYIDKGMGYIPD